MRNWQIPTQPTQKIGVLLFDQFSNHCLANAVEPLRAANSYLGRDAYEWEFLSLSGSPVTSSSGLPVTPERSLSASGSGDALLIMPSYGARDLAIPSYAKPLRSAARRYNVLAGMDMGSWLMASAGLLSGHRATIHWDELEDFGEAFPDISVSRDKFVTDANRWSCGGAMTAFDLMLQMIGQTHGQALRLEVAALFRFDNVTRKSDNPGLRAKSQLVTAAVAIMRDRLEDPVTIRDLAQTLGCRQQQLEALFSAELAASPRTVYRRLRLSAARRYAQQTRLSIAEIAVRCGYIDPSAMTRAFREEFATTPTKLRAETTS